MAIPLDAEVGRDSRAAGHAGSPGSTIASAGGGRQTLITAPDGIRISVREWGTATGPEILFIHGVAQCHLSFQRQFSSRLAAQFRLVAYDLRGHGESAKPLDHACYRDGRRWADEVAAVIAAMG